MCRNLSSSSQHALSVNLKSSSIKQYWVVFLIVTDVPLGAHQVVGGQFIVTHRLRRRSTALRLSSNDGIGCASKIGGNSNIILPSVQARERNLAPFVKSAAQSGKMLRWRVHLAKMR